MKDSKIQKLLNSCEKHPARKPPEGFSERVIAVLPPFEREVQRVAPSIVELIDSLFPKLVWIPMAIIAMATVFELHATFLGSGSLSELTHAYADQVTLLAVY